MLDTQYRMHPNISSFPSTEFYLGGVRDGTIDAEGNVIAGLTPPKSVYLDAIEAPLEEGDAEEEAGGLLTPSSVVASGADAAETHRVTSKGKKRGSEREELCHFGQPSVIFLDHEGAETTKDRSRVNHAEAHIVASVVVDLLLNNPVSVQLNCRFFISVVFDWTFRRLASYCIVAFLIRGSLVGREPARLCCDQKAP
jgi:superfamily I DNA and/or RNA helicase